MLNPSNGLSFLRAPLALLFLIENATLRALVVVLAMITDCVDGYLARRYRYSSRFGAIFDPIMDKFFVFFALAILFKENRIASWQACSMLSRDFFLLIFGLYLAFSKNWKHCQFRPILWGKITTALQFVVLIALSLGIRFPNFFYAAFILIGCFAFIELFQLLNTNPADKKPSS